MSGSVAIEEAPPDSPPHGVPQVVGQRALSAGALPVGRLVDVDSLDRGLRVCVNGTDDEHAALLAQAPGPLPPIVVHALTMTVVDGAHRLLAARMRGDHQIEAVFVDGDVADAFVLAVELNTRHGLPLSRSDRRAGPPRRTWHCTITIT